MVPAIIESVQTDGGALKPFATVTADQRDVDLSAGWNWIGVQASYGNGFLDRLEHRRRYKLNALKGWDLGAHKLTLLSIGYYGKSMIPGLVPVGAPDLHDTIDPASAIKPTPGTTMLLAPFRQPRPTTSP
jgi:hypothetical protein